MVNVMVMKNLDQRVKGSIPILVLFPKAVENFLNKDPRVINDPL